MSLDHDRLDYSTPDHEAVIDMCEFGFEERQLVTKELASFMIAGFNDGQLIVASNSVDQLYSRASIVNKPYTHAEADIFAKAAILAVSERKLPEESLITNRLMRSRNLSQGRAGRADVPELRLIDTV